MQCKSLWIKASAKCINVNVIVLKVLLIFECIQNTTKLLCITVINSFYLCCSHADLVASMRQAELCDWALDSTLFTSLCDSLNRFFTQKGLINSSSGGPSSFGQMAPPTMNMPPAHPPSLASLTHPSPLIYSSQLPPGTGGSPLLSPRRTLTPHTQNQTAQRSPGLQPTTSQPLTPNGTLQNDNSDKPTNTNSVT